MDVDAFWQARESELEEYARLALRVGVNIEEGQDVTVSCYVEHAPLARAIGRVAYAEGARRVDAGYLDVYLRRSRAELAPDEAVSWTPPWALQKVKEEGERRAAFVNIVGEPDPNLFNGIDAGRVARSVIPELRQAYWHAFDRGEMPWTIIAFPTPGWAEQAFGEPDVGRLWDAIRATVRLDEPDPVGAWREHITVLQERAGADERAWLRRGALPWPGHRPDRRAARAVAVDGRGQRDRLGALLHAEPADRGGLHDSGPAADRGSRQRNAAARAPSAGRSSATSR